MRLLLLLACALATAAGEPSPASAAERAAARTLHQRAASVGEVWTAIQLESWGRAHGLALPAILGASEIIGEPRFALPQDIQALRDRSATVAVVAGERFFQFAGDGRPLALPVKLGFVAEGSTMSGDGTILGISRQTWGATGTVEVETRHVPSGARVLGHTFAKRAGEYLAGGFAMADDGTAVTIHLRADRPTGSTSRWLLARAAGGESTLDGVRDMHAIGSQGAWTLSSDVNGRALRLPSGPVPVRDHAQVHGGIAVLTQDARVLLVNPSGETRPLPLPLVLGGHPQIETVGDWLLLHSGDGAKTAPGRDALDRETGGGDPLPATMLWWSLPQLAAGQMVPAGSRPAPWSLCRLRPAAFYAWSSAGAAIVDLDRGETALALAATMAAPSWIDDDGTRLFTRVRHQDGAMTVLDAANRVRFHGPASDFWAHGWRSAIVAIGNGDQRRYQIAGLDLDPARRRVVDLEPDQRGYGEVYADQFDRRVVMVQRGPASARWCELDPFTGKTRIAGEWRPLGGSPVPHAERFWSSNHGRFMAWGARLMIKANDPEAPSPATLRPTDAWRVGANTLITTADHRVLVTGRTPSDLILVGSATAEHGRITLATTPQSQLLVVRNQDFQAMIVPGPALDPSRRPPPRDVDTLPNRAFNIRGQTFNAGADMHWDDDRMGYRPERLRASGPDRLVCVFDSLIIQLVPDAIRLIGAKGRG